MKRGKLAQTSIENIPNEIFMVIFTYVHPYDLFNSVEKVSRRFYDIINDIRMLNLYSDVHKVKVDIKKEIFMKSCSVTKNYGKSVYENIYKFKRAHFYKVFKFLKKSVFDKVTMRGALKGTIVKNRNKGAFIKLFEIWEDDNFKMFKTFLFLTHNIRIEAMEEEEEQYNVTVYAFDWVIENKC